MPPIEATSATSGTVFSSYRRNQSCSARSCPRSFWPRPVHERVLIDPAHSGRVRTERRLGARRQPGLHLIQVFQHPRARPVRIRPVLEQDVDEGIAEHRIAANRLRARHRHHGGGERIGDLVFDDARRLPGEGRADDDLRVGQVRYRVQRRAQKGNDAPGRDNQRGKEDEKTVADGPADEPGDHLAPAGRIRSIT